MARATAHRQWIVGLVTILLFAWAMMGCDPTDPRKSGSAIGQDGGTDTGAPASGGIHGMASGGSDASGGAGGSDATGGAGGRMVLHAPGSHCTLGETLAPGARSANVVYCGTVPHRVATEACPPSPASSVVLPASGLTDQCRRDADCRAKVSGHCFNDSGVGGRTGNSCRYDCGSDSDCPNGAVCDCVSQACTTATCTTDASCDDGKLCVRAADHYNANGSLTTVFRCQTTRDECVIDSGDCAPYLTCRWGGDRFACLTPLPTP